MKGEEEEVCVLREIYWRFTSLVQIKENKRQKSVCKQTVAILFIIIY